MGQQIILEIDEATWRELEAVAPSRQRKRSEFLRRALRRALDEEAEARMRQAYRRQPDREHVYADPAAWDPAPVRRRATRKPR